MRKIINNKVYDTETAKKRGEWSNGRSHRDLSWCEEALYQKKTGEFFLHGEGGTLSRYIVQRDDNCWVGGERIIPLSVEAARIWAETHLEADEYEAMFGPVVENDSRVSQTFSIAADTLERLRRISRFTGDPMGVIIDGLVQAVCEKT